MVISGYKLKRGDHEGILRAIGRDQFALERNYQGRTSRIGGVKIGSCLGEKMLEGNWKLSENDLWGYPDFD